MGSWVGDRVDRYEHAEVSNKLTNANGIVESFPNVITFRILILEAIFSTLAPPNLNNILDFGFGSRGRAIARNVLGISFHFLISFPYFIFPPFFWKPKNTSDMLYLKILNVNTNFLVHSCMTICILSEVHLWLY